MKERKLRIAEFVESIDSETMSSSVLLGGTLNFANGDTEPPVKENTGDCTNLDATCKSSINTGTCENSRGMCGGTKNGANCRDIGTSEFKNITC